MYVPYWSSDPFDFIKAKDMDHRNAVPAGLVQGFVKSADSFFWVLGTGLLVKRLNLRGRSLRRQRVKITQLERHQPPNTLPTTGLGALCHHIWVLVASWKGSLQQHLPLRTKSLSKDLRSIYHVVVTI